MSFEVWIGMGTNMGSYEEIIQNTLYELQKISSQPLRCSSRYRSEPWGGVQQNDYQNLVVGLKVDIKKLDLTILESNPPILSQSDDHYDRIRKTEDLCELLLTYLQSLERKQGRAREQETIRWGPRTLDLDILEVTGGVNASGKYCSQRLILPHPRIHLRRFVLVPWCEVDSEFFIPAYGKTVQELLLECRDTMSIDLA